MRFLLDANLPRSAAGALRRLGYEAVEARDVGLGEAEDELVAAYAKANGLALITRDFDFSDVRNYPPTDYAGIVVLEQGNLVDVADLRPERDGELVRAVAGQTQLFGIIAFDH